MLKSTNDIEIPVCEIFSIEIKFDWEDRAWECRKCFYHCTASTSKLSPHSASACVWVFACVCRF